SGTASGSQSTNIGVGGNATSEASISFGLYAQSTATYSISIGRWSYASADYSISITSGLSTTVQGTYDATCTYAITVGYRALSTGSGAVVIGANAQAGANGIALGANAVAGDNEIALGNKDLGSATQGLYLKGGVMTAGSEVATKEEFDSLSSKVDKISGYVEDALAELDKNSWEIISKVSQAGLAASYWSVGDTKTITVSGTVGTLSVSDSYNVYILGFNHNSTYEGSNTIHFGCFKTTGGVDVALVDSCYGSSSIGATKYFNMNHSGNNNYGGWAACDMRYDILGSTNVNPQNYGSAHSSGDAGYNPSSTCATSPVGDTLMAALPSDLRAVMKPMTKYTDNVAGATNVAGNISATTDYLPLLAEYEVQGTRSYANTYEKNYQAQYDYYKNGNSKIKYQHSASSTTCFWWLRSAYYSYSNYFCGVVAGGGAGSGGANNARALAPAFCI
ncbi:MAG: DUF6273 domain-containing protein, partial [Clostridia bacterium]|nr:DUF6273 domain-containing protein [Clostridia bacterium]